MLLQVQTNFTPNSNMQVHITVFSKFFKFYLVFKYVIEIKCPGRKFQAFRKNVKNVQNPTIKVKIFIM